MIRSRNRSQLWSTSDRTTTDPGRAMAPTVVQTGGYEPTLRISGQSTEPMTTRLAREPVKPATVPPVSAPRNAAPPIDDDATVVIRRPAAPAPAAAAPAPATHSRRGAVLAVFAAAIVLAAGAGWMFGGRPDPAAATPAETPAAASPMPVAVPPVEPVTAMPVAATAEPASEVAAAASEPAPAHAAEVPVAAVAASPAPRPRPRPVPLSAPPRADVRDTVVPVRNEPYVGAQPRVPRGAEGLIAPQSGVAEPDAPLPGTRVPAMSAGPQSPRQACGNRSFIALARCMERQCVQPRFQSHPQCDKVRRMIERRERG